MAKRKALGRGLESLLGDAAEAYSKELGFNVGGVAQIEIALIETNPFQPRKNFDEQALQELASSIEEFGLIQPIIVLKKSEDAYILIAGERRLRATKMLGNTEIKAVILDTDESKLRELALVENIQREDLNPIELANSYKDLIESLDITQDELASYIHKSRTQVTNTLRLLNLDERTQKLIMEGKITQGHAKILVGLDKDDEKKAVDTIIGQKLNVRDTEKIIQKIKKGDKFEAFDENWQKEFEKLQKHLKKLDIPYKTKNSQITLHLHNVDKIKELNALW